MSAKSHDRPANSQKFDYLKINIASPEDIRGWSFGEVDKPETINYRTLKPERSGLFCAKIFGPIKDYECLCGKYKRIKHRGVVCDKCGVEVTVSRVRRERMGHIELAAPIAHVWFLKSPPSRIGNLLDISLKELERVLYFEAYIVIDPGISPFKRLELLNKEQLAKAQDEYGSESFTAMIGAEAIRHLLENMNLAEISQELQKELVNTTSDAKKKKFTKRLKLVEDFLDSGNKPEWMILTVLPVLPPELRPLVPLEGGRFATSDLNDLYRKVIHRNNRLRKLKELDAPEIMLHNEERMLQEAVDALFDNGRRGKVLKGNNKRPLKSLSDMLKGKQGRFRQNLLGKRVDYSGRSVIVSGPELQLHQCGLPKKMALELYKPFVYGKLVSYGLATTIKAARRLVELEKPEVWDVLEEVIFEHPVLLNRAPTLHRLGIQAFEPQLIEGKAIQLHPLVCSAFNADYDGDQMAVHVPLSIEAQIEARVLMMSTNNILSPANGRPIIQPDQDIVLGLYYLTEKLDNQPGAGRYFSNMAEVHHALENNVISLHAPIKYRINVSTEEGSGPTLIETTGGRLILRNIVPSNINFELVNKNMTKKDISALMDSVYRLCGQQATVVFADALKELGFKYASISGISFGMDDMIVPGSKSGHVLSTLEEVKEFEQQYADGLITKGEKYNKVIDAWGNCTDKVAVDMMREIENYRLPADGAAKNVNGRNSIFMMIDSGARGSRAQTRQLAGMRGLMAKPSGEIIETPIISSFSEGLDVIEYFKSTHGARKGLIDTALKTADSGYLTRKLVDATQDCIITSEDCMSTSGIVMRVESTMENSAVTISLSEQILGRSTTMDIYHPITAELIIAAGELIDEDTIKAIEAAGIEAVKVRSVLTCKLTSGVCAKCYGRNLSTGKLVSVGEAVGVIAAQSIGEPGTQLTMRTFHVGGAATKGTEITSIEADADGKIKILNRNIVINSEGANVVMSRSCEVMNINAQGQEQAKYKVPYGARLLLDEGAIVKKGDKIADWDPYTIPIITEKSGTVVFHDIVEGISVRTVNDEITGIATKVITESRKYASGADLRPRIHLLDEEGNVIILSNGLEARYYMQVNAILNVEERSVVRAGDILARIPRELVKTRDITGGLPRVAELFEARKPKDHSIIADTDGRIEFGKDYKSKRRVILHPNDGSTPIEYMATKGKHIMVNDGEFIKKGDMIVDGAPLLQDILRVMGAEALGRYMVREVQNVYRLQGVKIDDKHIEIVIRQMLRQVQVTDPGDTNLLIDERIDKSDLLELNNKMIAKGLKTAQYQENLQGITKAALQTRSFISAAAFQETPKILTDAALRGAVDYLRDPKENVAVGRYIPAGTGLWSRRLSTSTKE